MGLVRKFIVLIETYWNVKICTYLLLHLPLQVLIETYWNVKQDTGLSYFQRSGSINRNILECKASLR